MTIVLAEDHPAEDRSKSQGIKGTQPTIHLSVSDIRARYSDLTNSGVALFPPERNHWGTEWFVVRDPDGNLIAFEQKDGA